MEELETKISEMMQTTLSKLDVVIRDKVRAGFRGTLRVVMWHDTIVTDGHITVHGAALEPGQEPPWSEHKTIVWDQTLMVDELSAAAMRKMEHAS